MHHAIGYRIDPKHPLFEWADSFSHSENNMRNATLFRIRNLMTGLSKKPDDRHPLEAQVLDEFQRACQLDPKWTMPTPDKWVPSFTLLDYVFKTTDNPDYYQDDYSVKTAQASIRQVRTDMDSFFKAISDFKKHPSKYKTSPQLPGYKPKGGRSTFTIDNQEAKVRQDSRGRQLLKLPKTETRLALGRFIPADWSLVLVKVKPDGNGFMLRVVFDDDEEVPSFEDHEPCRIAAGDLGVDNLIACVSNTGSRSLIIKGGALKSVNQWTNKRFAHYQSKNMEGGESTKLEMDDEAWGWFHHRADKFSDYFHKAAILVRDWCVENRIDTFVLGYNAGWKDGVVMVHESKQSFIQIPFAQFKAILQDKLERVGIMFVEQEESYTSKASLLDLDSIPVYGDEKPDGGWRFSGYRESRGLYRLKGRGVSVNADLNGAGNILRKAFPWAFDEGRGVMPELCDRSQVIIVKHPDQGAYTPGQSRKQPSLSKARRLARKQGMVDERGCAVLSGSGINFAKRSPTGIELDVIA